MSAQPEASVDIDPELIALENNKKRKEMDQENAQSRLRTAKKAYEKKPCPRTEDKVQLETRLRREAGEKLLQARRALKDYERMRGLHR